jgi:hypothetical protein
LRSLSCRRIYSRSRSKISPDERGYAVFAMGADPCSGAASRRVPDRNEPPDLPLSGPNRSGGATRQREFNVADTASIKEHMEVVGSDGGHVGTVDHLAGQRIKLTRNDPAAGGEHHFIHVDSIASVDDKVRLNRTAAEAKDEWGVESVG